MSAAVEAELAALLRAGSLDRAATRILEAYGSELYGFLLSIVGAESDAKEVFSQFVEDCWRGLPKFNGASTVRTWLYVLLRHAASRYQRSPWNRIDRRAGDSAVDSLVATAHSRTPQWLRTSTRDRWRTLRESLPVEDRSLLILRIDRGLAWEEIARIMLDEADPDRDALRRESERLRKRFQLLKDGLRDRARALGLLEDGS